MSIVIGTVNFLVGQVVAVDADGSERLLQLGDTVLSDEQIRPMPGAEIEIALFNGDSVVLADGDIWTGADSLSAEVLAQLQSDAGPIGTVNSVSGTVVAVAADGSERVLLPGDPIYADETIRTGPDSFVELAMNGAEPVILENGQSWLATSDTYTPSSEFDPSVAALSDIDALQQAILAGVDPTQVGEATAAGGEPAAGDVAADGGGSNFVSLDRSGNEVNPSAGYRTGAFSTTTETPEEEQPVIQTAVVEPEPAPEPTPEPIPDPIAPPPVDLQPIAVDDEYNSRDGAVVSGDVSGNDIESGDGTHSYALTSELPGLDFNSDGTFSYTPSSPFEGDVTFTYDIVDEDGDRSSATVTITGGITPVEPPVTPPPPVEPPPPQENFTYAVNDSVGTDFGEPVNISVLTNDNDPEGHTQTITGTTDPSNGSIVVNSNGTITYTPDPKFSGEDTFTYTIDDGNGATDTATVTVDVDSEPTIDVIYDAPNGDRDAGLVDEDALDNVSNDDDGETTSGTLVIASGTDTPVIVKVGTTTLSQANDGDITTVAGDNGDAVFTYVAATGNFTWEYTLDTVESHTSPASGADENIAEGVELFTVTVTDIDGSEVTGSLVIDVKDDIPTVVDSNVVLNSSGATSVSGVWGTSGADGVSDIEITKATTTLQMDGKALSFNLASQLNITSGGEVIGVQLIGATSADSNATELNVYNDGTYTLNVDQFDSVTTYSTVGAPTPGGPEPVVYYYYDNSAAQYVWSEIAPVSGDGDTIVTVRAPSGSNGVNVSGQGFGLDDNLLDFDLPNDLERAADNVDPERFTMEFTAGTTYAAFTVNNAAADEGVRYSVNGGSWITKLGEGLVEITGSISSIAVEALGTADNDWVRITNLVTKVSTPLTDLDIDFEIAVTDSDGDVSIGAIGTSVGIAPVVMDLDRDGTEYLSREAGVVFTDQATGKSVNTAWVGPDDGLLVIDANNSGTVDESREYVFTEWSETAETDMEAIAEVFDTNQDGVLDAQDDQWDQFRVWQDKDSDGQTDEGELVSLGDLMIESIDLTYVADSHEGTSADGDVVIHGQSAVTYTDGSTTIAEDTSFAISEADLLNTEELLLDEGTGDSVAAAPNPDAANADSTPDLSGADVDLQSLLPKVDNNGDV